jgi:hypothetical protein
MINIYGFRLICDKLCHNRKKVEKSGLYLVSSMSHILTQLSKHSYNAVNS